MDLSLAAGFFDTTQCVDAYNTRTKFLGQLDLYDDSKRDGVTVERRILSVAPGTVIPARRTIMIEGEAWIVGARNVDTFQGSAVRHKYVIHQATNLGNLSTALQALTSGGLPVYAAAVWLKDSKDVETSSKIQNYMNTYYAVGEPANVGSILKLGNKSYRLRNVYDSAAGVQVGEASEMPRNTLQAVSYTPKASNVYDPVNDAYTSGLTVVTNALWERFQDNYNYESASAPKYEIGDVLITLSKAVIASPLVADKVTLLGVTWSVVAYQTDSVGTCWEMQVRRA